MELLTTLSALLAFQAVGVSAKGSHSKYPSRPNVHPHPHHPGHSSHSSPPRHPDHTCYVQAGNSTWADRDDAPAILSAVKKCNHGGTIVLDDIYRISSPLDLTFMNAVDLVITGQIHFNDDDVYYWAENSFKFAFQNQSVFWKLGGKDVNVYGNVGGEGDDGNSSLIDGHGQNYWTELASNSTLLRPMLFAFDGLDGGVMAKLRMRNPPNWFNIIANSTDVLVTDMDLRAESTDGVKIANSDGWDTYRSDGVVIQDSYISNTDDCVSFKPNSTNIVVQNLVCTGSHGISIGSLGQYKGVVDIVENLTIYNISMSNASDGARIKVWPGVETAFQALLNGGGGLGHVRNVTYNLFGHHNNDNAITITQCYGQSNQTLCNEFPANLTIEDITMKNMYGVTSTKYDPRAGSLVCSAPDRCSNIVAQNITVEVPSGEPPVYVCTNLDEDLLDITCVDG